MAGPVSLGIGLRLAILLNMVAHETGSLSLRSGQPTVWTLLNCLLVHPLSTLRPNPYGADRMTGPSWFRYCFIVEDFHLLHYAGFYRRYLGGTRFQLGDSSRNLLYYQLFTVHSRIST